ncbi:hypothetical protein DYB28_013010, partial [Aphanomyces astaci]
VGLVAEQVAKNSKPLEEQSKRVLSHAADLITLAPQLFTSVPPTLSEPSATTSATDDDKLQHEFSSLSTTTPYNDVASTALPPASPAPEVPPSTPSQPYSPPRPQPTQLEALRPSIEAKEWTEKHVPSSPLARIVGFGALAARLAVGTATAVIQNQGSSEKKSIHQAFVSDANAERLADALCTMRGIRNHVARQLLQLTIHELFVWRFMQTDPNWSNFLYDPESGKIGLIDFGAARAYPKEFVDTYFDIVWGAAQLDAKAMMDSSFKLGFLT